MDVFRQVSLNDREFRFVRFFSQKPIGFRYASRWCGSVEPQIWSTEYIYKYIAYSSSLSPLDISFAIRNNSAQKCAKSSWTSFSMWDRNLYRTASNNEYNTGIIKPSYVPFSSPQTWRQKVWPWYFQKPDNILFPGFPVKWVCPKLGDTLEIFL